ncbi:MULTISPECIES: A24 family peptidase [unclassified Candidatus Frackibacter]|uniref:A24 family peptidase n=1 Tax=unclassified Candidatus Frackibacter TaxID=2648818 RepID=UPI000888645A|nr:MULTISPECIES: prepilin peptidase [unclassified Candidatus Frackibacter]SDC72147.1 prepilin peptidase CpaA [Candidatus Frackibacter sp. WG11]SEM86443.1 prepilin peptidase CpaA [Candidatus Frackibacter sp. WG12]SFL95491.1 prepilin peptidase CpaA [Candidatus Frackibacter sp. WG13]
MLNLFLGISLLIPLWTDIKEGIIPNYYTGSLIAFGIIINLYLHSWSGVIFSLSGFFVGLFIFLVPYVLGGLGAGDVKLLAAIGAVKGAKFIFIDSLVVAVVGGLISLFILVMNKRLNILINKLLYKSSLEDLSHKNGKNSFAYGVAITTGTWIIILYDKFQL